MTLPAAYQAGGDQLAALLRDYYDTCQVQLAQPIARKAVLAAHRYFHGLLAVMAEQVATVDALRSELILHVVAIDRLMEGYE